MLRRLRVLAFEVFALGTAIYSTSLFFHRSISAEYITFLPLVSIHYNEIPLFMQAFFPNFFAEKSCKIYRNVL